ncbi:MAG: CinA family protein [Alphaproteobacteria bacterium]|nr:CinA family protein [Alphaproteobacteria bacterium]
MARDHHLMPDDLIESAGALLDLMTKHNLMLTTAESCTGGLIAAAMTEVPGSSAVIDRGFVTYTNEAKTEMLGVDADLIKRVGAVSEEVAKAMAEGALARSNADVAVSVTGIAGPGGGSEEKPVGTVHIGCALKGEQVFSEKHKLPGHRGDVRGLTVALALSLVEAMVLRRFEGQAQ